MKPLLVILFLMFISLNVFCQPRKDLYYFSMTGDTILFPNYSWGDSTYLSVSTFKDGKETQLDQIPVYGFDHYAIPQGTITKYHLTVTGSEVEASEKTIYVKEKVTKNEQIGFSLNGTDYMYRIKFKLSTYLKGKEITTIKIEGDYDALQKKDFSKETYIIPVIVKMDSKELYFVMMWLRKRHPAIETRTREMLNDFNTGRYARLIVK